MTAVPLEPRRSRWRPRWRDLLGLLALVAALGFVGIAREFGGQSRRLLLIGPFDDLALRGLLLSAGCVCGAAWIVSRCWVRPPRRAAGVAASIVATMLVVGLAMIPALFGLLMVGLSLDSSYVRVPGPAQSPDDHLVLYIFDSWDDDESTQLYRRDGSFTYTATRASGYSRCVDEIQADDLVVSVVDGATTVSTDLADCDFTPLVVE